MEIKRIPKYNYQDLFFPYPLMKSFLLFTKFIQKEFKITFKKIKVLDPDNNYASLTFISDFTYKPVNVTLKANRTLGFYLIIMECESQEYYSQLLDSFDLFFQFYTPNEIIEKVRSEEKTIENINQLIYGTQTGNEIHPEVFNILEQILLSSSDDTLKESLLLNLSSSNYVFPLKQVFKTIRDSRPNENILFVLDMLEIEINEIQDFVYKDKSKTYNFFIDIKNQKLKSIPNSYLSNEEIVVFEASENCLTNLPLDFFKNTSIKRMNLGDNFLIDIPKDIELLINLEEFILNNNNLLKIPSLNKNKELKKLAALNNNITEIGTLPHSLERLQVGNNCLEEINNQFNNLPNLKYLYFSHNKIRQIKNAFKNLPNLLELDLSHNLLKYIPENIHKLSSLERLNLSNCPILMIPEDFDFPQNLTSISISYSKLKQISVALFRIEKLEDLDLSNSEIEEFPENISEARILRKLNLSENKIKKISKELFLMDNLKVLNLFGNPINIEDKNDIIEWANINKITLFI